MSPALDPLVNVFPARTSAATALPVPVLIALIFVLNCVNVSLPEAATPLPVIAEATAVLPLLTFVKSSDNAPSTSVAAKLLPVSATVIFAAAIFGPLPADPSCVCPTFAAPLSIASISA